MPDSHVALTDLSNAMAGAVERVAASLVTVRGRARQPATGLAYAPGLVLTANHVLERDEDLAVDAPDGASHSADLAGRDPATDLAVLRVPGLELAPATAGAAARVGQLALAVGRPSSRGVMASLGVVSLVGGPLRTGRGLRLERYIRTDATPYPGFSGGPLIDAGGAVLGITTTGFSAEALAIPAELAWATAAALAEHGSPVRGYLGVTSQPVRLPEAQRGGRDQDKGLLLVHIEDGSPAMQGGLLLGDVVISLDSQPVVDTDDLLSLLARDRAGKTVAVEVVRGAAIHTLSLAVGQRKTDR